MKKQKKDKRRQSTQQLMGVKKITDYCISTDAGDLVFLYHQAHEHQRPPGWRSQREDPCAAEHTQRTGGRGAAGNELP